MQRAETDQAGLVSKRLKRCYLYRELGGLQEEWGGGTRRHGNATSLLHHPGGKNQKSGLSSGFLELPHLILSSETQTNRSDLRSASCSVHDLFSETCSSSPRPEHVSTSLQTLDKNDAFKAIFKTM